HLLKTFFTGLIHLSLHLIDVPVGTAPDDDVVDHTVRAVVHVRNIVSILTIVVQVRFEPYLGTHVKTNRYVEVVSVEVGVWYLSFFVIVRIREPEIVIRSVR